MKRVFIPFDLPAFETINSNHPLPTSLIEPQYAGIEFVRANTEAAVAPAAAQDVYTQSVALLERFRATAPPMADFDGLALEFIQSRDLVSQAYIDRGADLAFFHTAPMHLDQMPWLLHIENVTTLFHPALAQGDCQNIALRDIPAFWFVRTMLESARCRGVFTNLSMTKDQVDRVFDSEVISRKTCHIPPGPYFTVEEEALIAAAVEHKRDKSEIEILFTNSWHQRWGNFFLRGGPELIVGFLAMETKFPNVRLTLRTVWPEMLQGTELERRVRNHPKITLIETKMSDEDMLNLFARADIFALDAANVHSVSILRAMACAAVCIVSDVPGYEDYVTSGETAVIVPGRRETIFSIDEASGWLRDDVRPMFSLNGARAAAIADLLSLLCSNQQLRLTIGMNARRQVQSRNSFANWSRGFETLLRGALGS